MARTAAQRHEPRRQAGCGPAASGGPAGISCVEFNLSSPRPLPWRMRLATTHPNPYCSGAGIGPEAYGPRPDRTLRGGLLVRNKGVSIDPAGSRGLPRGAVSELKR